MDGYYLTSSYHGGHPPRDLPHLHHDDDAGDVQGAATPATPCVCANAEWLSHDWFWRRSSVALAYSIYMCVCVCARARGVQVVTGQDVTPEKPCKRVNIATIIADIKFRGVTSGVCVTVYCV
jgi:hypothetical protein